MAAERSPDAIIETALLGPAQKAYLEEFITRYRRRTAASRKIAAEARPVLADPLRPGGFHPALKEICYPITAVRCTGSRFWDADANEYVDFCMGFGSALFGHSPAFLQAALREQIEKGFQLGPQSELALEVARRVSELTGMERVAFSSSGTEAVMTALRLARVATGRDKIALFSGSYHGQFDGTLAIADPSGGNPWAVPMVPGVAPGSVGDVMVLAYGAGESLATIFEHSRELAAVLVEPLQSRRPDLCPRDFLHDLRRLTEQWGIALIFDEMITGFRLAPGGAQQWFGIGADLAAYGKAAGGGLPIGIVAGKSRYMDGIDGGTWSFGDSSCPRARMTFFASTFAKHPLSMAAARVTLRQLAEAGPALQERLNERTAQFVASLNRSMEEEGVTLRFAGFGSYFAPVPPFEDPRSMAVQLIHHHLAEQGLFLWGAGGFLSTAHSPEELDRLCLALRTTVRSLRNAGFRL